MTWDSLHKDVHRRPETCKSFQNNERSKHKYDKLSTKFSWTVLWKVLYVDLISLYVLKGKNGSEANFMCLTMLYPFTNWIELVRLPVVALPQAPCTSRQPSAGIPDSLKGPEPSSSNCSGSDSSCCSSSGSNSSR